MSESDPESCRFLVVLLVSFGSQISDLQNFGFFAHPSDERNHGSVWSKASFSENLGSSWLWINLNGMPWGYYYDLDLDFDPELHCWRSRSFGQIRSHVSKKIQLGFVRRMISPIRHFFFRWFFEVFLGYLVRQRTDLYSSGYIFPQFDGIQLGSSWFLGLIRTDLWIDWSTIGIQLERWDDYCRSEEGDFWSVRQHPATSQINLQAKESIGTLGVSRSQRDLKSVRFIGVNDLDPWQHWAWLRFIWAFCVAYPMIDGKILVSVGLNLSRSQNLQQAKEKRENWEVTPCQWLTESGGIFPDSILESSDEVRDTLSGLYGDSPWESTRCNLKVLLIQYQIRRLLVSGLIQRINLTLTLKGIDSLDPDLSWQLWVLKVTARSELQAAFAVHSSVSYCSLRFSKSFTGFYGKVSLGFRSVSLVKMSQSSMLEKESVEKSLSAVVSKLWIKIPSFENSALIKGYSKTMMMQSWFYQGLRNKAFSGFQRAQWRHYQPCFSLVSHFNRLFSVWVQIDLHFSYNNVDMVYLIGCNGGCSREIYFGFFGESFLVFVSVSVWSRMFTVSILLESFCLIGLEALEYGKTRFSWFSLFICFLLFWLQFYLQPGFFFVAMLLLFGCNDLMAANLNNESALSTRFLYFWLQDSQYVESQILLRVVYLIMSVGLGGPFTLWNDGEVISYGPLTLNYVYTVLRYLLLVQDVLVKLRASPWNTVFNGVSFTPIKKPFIRILLWLLRGQGGWLLPRMFGLEIRNLEFQGPNPPQFDTKLLMLRREKADVSGQQPLFSKVFL